jgi:hypothetical protein
MPANPNQDVAVVGSPSTNTELTVDLLQEATEERLVGALTAFGATQNGQPIISVGQIVGIELKNRWHEDSVFRNLVKRTGEIPPIMVFNRKSWEWFQAQEPESPGSTKHYSTSSFKHIFLRFSTSAKHMPMIFSIPCGLNISEALTKDRVVRVKLITLVSLARLARASLGWRK